jgi:hypothetical protein
LSKAPCSPGERRALKLRKSERRALQLPLKERHALELRLQEKPAPPSLGESFDRVELIDPPRQQHQMHECIGVGQQQQRRQKEKGEQRQLDVQERQLDWSLQ